MNLDEVRAAVTRVLNDLGVDLRIEVELVEDGLTQFLVPEGITSTRLDVDSEAELLVRVADLVQNDVNFWLPDAWGEALPPCPGHPHPMDARVDHQLAWWVCPRSGARTARVGELRG